MGYFDDLFPTPSPAPRSLAPAPRRGSYFDQLFDSSPLAPPPPAPSFIDRTGDVFNTYVEPVLRPLSAPFRGIGTVATAAEGALTEGDPLAKFKLAPGEENQGVFEDALGAVGIGHPSLEQKTPYRAAKETLQTAIEGQPHVGGEGYAERLADVFGEAGSQLALDPVMHGLLGGGTTGKVLGAAFVPGMAVGAAQGAQETARSYRETGLSPQTVGAGAQTAIDVGFTGLGMAAATGHAIAGWKERAKIAEIKGEAPPPPPPGVPEEHLTTQPPPMPNWTSPSVGQAIPTEPVPTGEPGLVQAPGVFQTNINPDQRLLPAPNLEALNGSPSLVSPPSLGGPPILPPGPAALLGSGVPGELPAPSGAGAGAGAGRPEEMAQAAPQEPVVPIVAAPPATEPAPVGSRPPVAQAGQQEATPVQATPAEAAPAPKRVLSPEEMTPDQLDHLRDFEAKSLIYSGPERRGSRPRATGPGRYEELQAKIAALEQERTTLAAGQPPQHWSQELSQKMYDLHQQSEALSNEAEALWHPSWTRQERGFKSRTPGTLREKLQARGDAALERLKARGASTDATAGIDPGHFADFVDYGASRIAVYGLDKAKWAGDLVQQFGEGIKAHLDEIWEKARNLHGWLADQYKGGEAQDPSRVGYAVRGTVARYMEAHPELTSFDTRTKTLLPLDEARAKRTADAFEAMKHDPQDPRVKASYDAMKADTMKQYDFLQTEGYKLEPWEQEGQPYKNSAEMRKDVTENKHLWYFKSEGGFGEGQDTTGHPLLERAPNGLLYNDMFRAVHDVFAHAKEGFEFGPKGEENAWHEHYQMFSPEARPAMTTETRGQNSWVNFGKHLRNAAGEVPKKGEPGYVEQAKRPFSEQKVGLLPAEAQISQIPPKAPFEPEAVRSEVKTGDRSVTGEVIKGSAKISEIAKALEDRTREKWGVLTGKDSSKMVDRAVKLGRDEVAYQLEQVKTGKGWYTKDVAEMESAMKKVFPDLEDQGRMDLFKAVVSSSAGGNHPDLNLSVATQVWEHFNKTGEFPLKNPSNGKEWAGQPSPSVSLAKLNTLRERTGSWEAAVKWLHDDHPVSELREINMNVAGKADMLKPGSTVLGPKLSPFLQNLYGNHESLTADMWFSRSWNRWMGTMFDGVKNGRDVVSSPRSEAERALMTEAVEKIAAEFKMSTADTQAVLWYYEQQLYKTLGARIEEGSYASAAQKVADARGVRLADAGEGGPAQAGREAPVPGAGPAGGPEARQPALSFGVSDTPPEGPQHPTEASPTREEVGSPSGLEGAYEAALARLKAKGKEATAFGGAPIDPTQLKDFGVVGAHWVTKGVKSLAEFTTKLVSEFGEGLRSLASSIWDHVQSLMGRGAAAEATVPPPSPVSAAAGAAPPSGPRPTIKPIPPRAPGAAPAEPSPTPKAGVPTFTPEQAAAAREFQGAPQRGKPEGKGRPEDVDINTGRISADKIVEELNARLVESAPGYFGKVKGGARGAVSDWETVRLKAIALGADEAQLKAAFKKSGGFLTDVDLERAGIAQKDLTAEAQSKWADFERLTKEGKTEDADDARRLYDSSISRLASINYVLIGAKANAARALQIGRKLAERATPEEKFLKKVADDSGFSDALRKQIYESLLKKDYKKARELTSQAYNPTFLAKVVEGWKAGLLSGVPTQVVNFASTGTKTSLIDPIEAVVSGALDAFKGIPDAQRSRFAGEGKAMLRGATSGLDFALNDSEVGLFPALKSIFSGQYESKEFSRQLAKGEQGEFERPGAIGGKFGEIYRIPFQLLQASDAFWKNIAGNQSLYRQAFRTGMRKSLRGEALESHIKDFVERYSLGTLENLDAVKAEIKNARLSGSFQEPLGTFGRGLVQMTNAHPWLDFVIPFKKTPINIAKETLARTPLGLADAYYKFKKGKLTEAQFRDRQASALVGTTIATSLYWAAVAGSENLGLTGGGPTDPEEQQNLKDTGWQPYSIKIGGKYISYQRLEPLSSIIGFAADAKELHDAKSVGEAVDKAASSIAQNLTNKTFLQGLVQFGNAIRDPKREFKTWVKQMESSLVPAIVGKAAQAIDPTVRVTDPYSLSENPVVARIPGLSSTLPERRTPVGGSRERVGGPVEQFLNPFPISEDKKGPIADVQREYARLAYVPHQPQKVMTLSGGKKIDLDPREYEMMQDTYTEAAARVAKVIKSSYYRALPDEAEGPGLSKREVIEKIYRDAKVRGRAKLYQDREFRVRAAQTQRAVKVS